MFGLDTITKKIKHCSQDYHTFVLKLIRLFIECNCSSSPIAVNNSCQEFFLYHEHCSPYYCFCLGKAKSCLLKKIELFIKRKINLSDFVNLHKSDFS